MEVSKILKMDCSETEKLGMLFSGRMDAMNVFEEGRGAVTIKAWDDLFQDLIVWKNAPENTSSNSDYAKYGMYQCPYNKSCHCKMDEPCRGCETWAAYFA